MKGRSALLRAALFVLMLALPGAMLAQPATATPAPPTVTNVNPNTGLTLGGETVTITGTGFTGASSVDFGPGNGAASFTINSTTQITLTAPSGAAGTVDVTVTGPGGTSLVSSADQFTYVTPPVPLVTSISPSTGYSTGGDSVTVHGTGFTDASEIDFGLGNPVESWTVNSDTQISLITPTGSVGTVDVTVTTPGGTSLTSSADQFTYVTPPVPAVTSVSPPDGGTAGGTSVVVMGSGFTGATEIDFGSGNPAAVWSVVSPTEMTASSPATPPGTVDVTVTTPGGTSPTTTADEFTFNAPTLPVVSSLLPSAGPTTGGTSVTISGSDFTGATNVEFGSKTATAFTVNTDSQITATSPSGTGTVDVTVTVPALGTSLTSLGDQFTYAGVPPVPTVTQISPTVGPTAGGTPVTVTGTGFTGATAVDFGPGVPAPTFTVVNDGTITTTTPAQAPGTFDVRVTTLGGTSATSSADQFTFQAPIPRPVVTSVSPRTGSSAGGTTITVFGTGFTGANGVNVGPEAAGFTVNSSTQITAVTPPESAGTVDVVVATPGGGASGTSSADQFTYQTVTTPVVTGIFPTSGPTAGGTSVTITGSGFNSVTALAFGGSQAANFHTVSSTQIVATSPAESAGIVDVRVTTGGGTSAATTADQFTFVTGTTPGAFHGYWLVAGDGGIFTFGSARFFGSTGSIRLQRPVVGMTPTVDRFGYWMVATDGGMFAFGDARFHGSIPGDGLAPAGSANPKRLAAPIVAMVASSNGGGYLLVASDGGVFAFGQAQFHGSCPGIGGCNGSVVAVVPDAGELGYWVVTSTGRVYPFGNAGGVAGGQPGATPAPITGATASATGDGYLIVDARGDVFAYGDARKFGGPPTGVTVPSTQIVGIVPTSDGAGYWLMGAKGAVYNYGDAPDDGSMAGRALNAPIVTAAGF